ncbi:DUF3540 domain-containing protein [Erwinia sp. E602]|uniref:DUF3540 domain-containing protein n=1 Tax=Erwinia sp. E602 TaxID=2675378 RepID=UPI001BAC91D0|nr:DUF3540 domain-containing protein [Erwinia sp. E602]
MSDHATVSRFRKLSRRQPGGAPVAPTAPECIARLATLEADKTGLLYIAGYRHRVLKIAVSCLTQPEVGDRVRFIEEGDNLIVLDLLYCADAGRCLTLSSQQPRMKIYSQQLDIEARDALSLTSDRLSVVSRSCRWLADHLQQCVRYLQQRSVHAERRVEQCDTVLAKHLVQSAEQSYRLESKLAAINASAVLKIDGAQIHMG